jgi:hypothetical protein
VGRNRPRGMLPLARFLSCAPPATLPKYGGFLLNVPDQVPRMRCGAAWILPKQLGFRGSLTLDLHPPALLLLNHEQPGPTSRARPRAWTPGGTAPSPPD